MTEEQPKSSTKSQDMDTSQPQTEDPTPQEEVDQSEVSETEQGKVSGKEDETETKEVGEEQEEEEEEEEPVEMVEIPAPRLEELESAEANFMEQLKRERAESINYRKRLQKQRDEFAEIASARILSKVITVKDDLKRVIDNANGEIPESHMEGIELVMQRLEGIFDQEGVELIKIKEGETMYNPNEMEAVVSQPVPDIKPNTVLGVINQGFKKGNRVLRAAKVMIAKAPPKETKKEDNEDDDKKSSATDNESKTEDKETKKEQETEESSS